MSLRCATLLLTAFLLASLTGCGDARIGLCSGSAEFCDDFLRDTFNDHEEPPADDDPPNTETALAVVEAVAVATETPQAVATAVSVQSMSQLARDDPDLVGLWLSAATLGRLNSPDNVSISEFLDLNRAWLSGATQASHSAAFDAGLALFAAFSRNRDPALAATAQSQVSEKTPAIPTGVAAEDENAITAHASILLGSYDADHCCQAEELAAATIVLCKATPSEGPTLDAAVRAACTNSMTWMAANMSLPSL